MVCCYDIERLGEKMTLHISNEEMASYLNLAYNSENFIKIVSSAKNEGNATLYFQKLGNAIAKYYISTGDNTLEGINAVCNLFMQSYLNGTFDDKFMELIISKCAKDIGIEKTPTIGEKTTIVNLVATRNINNQFYTHCFPGALYNTVKQNGLDISNEMFKEELGLLEKYFKTGFKTGKLCYCELSEASLSYANQSVPERVKFALGGNILFAKETKHESFLFSLRNNLIQLVQVGKLRKDDFNTVYMAGKKLIDFYCQSENSAIAVFRNNRPTRENNSLKLFNGFLVDSSIRNTLFANKLQKILMACQNNPNNMAKILDEGLEELEKIFPEFKQLAEKVLNNELIFQMKIRAVANFMHGGYADGYEIESGKLLPTEFAITVCPCPIDMWNKNHTLSDGNTLLNNEEKSNIQLPDAYKRISIVDRILVQASKEENHPDVIECINFGKSSIPVYPSISSLVFPNNYLINVESGIYTVSLFTEKALINRYLNKLRDEISTDVVKVKDIISRYKLTSNYDPDYEDDIEYDATMWFAKEIFNNYPEDVKKQMIKETAMLGNFIGIKKTEQGYLINYGAEFVTVPGEVLVDSKNNAPYNNLYSKMLEVAKNKMI